MTRYIFITGGVVSSLGKGVPAALIGRLPINRNLTIRMVKMVGAADTRASERG